MSRQGFSLVEFIVVITLMAILAVAATVQAPNLAGLRLPQAAVKLKSDIRYAQSYAIAYQQRTRIAFTTSTNSYVIYREPTAGSWVTLLNPLTRNNFTVQFGSGDFSGVAISQVNFGGANFHLVFDSAGTPFGYNPTNGAVAALASAGSVQLSGTSTTQTVSVTPQTGRASTQ